MPDPTMPILPPLEMRGGILPLLALSVISCGAALTLIASLSVMVWQEPDLAAATVPGSSSASGNAG